MIPIRGFIPNGGINITEQPSLSYRIRAQKERIQKYIDGIEAVKQAIYKILNTERYKYEIYDWNYGIELDELFGKPKFYVRAELPRRIEDALSVDDRIKRVYDFEFFDGSKDKKTTVFVRFRAETIFGDALIDWEAEFDV